MPGQYTLEFADDGPGVSKHFLPDMFKRFSREEQSRARHSGGSGLGLSIAQAICQAHGEVLARHYQKPEGFWCASSCPGALVTRKIPALDKPLTQHRIFLDEQPIK